jgi:hypothetical protein
VVLVVAVVVEQGFEVAADQLAAVGLTLLQFGAELFDALGELLEFALAHALADFEVLVGLLAEAGLKGADALGVFALPLGVA